ncbi:MAG: FAD-dependent oxidoreductase [Myxococcales bacterium]|nr:FAD-binding protein [Myxococcales bacterium]HIK84381.1 FAD-binding protein [Myxococcales bacterium]
MASIIVVGGGLAGLVCSARLQKAGHDVEIIEAELAVGGRLRPIETEHGLLPRGVGEVGWGDANLRSLVASLGLESVTNSKIKRAHALVLGGRLHRPPPLRPLEFLFPRLSPRMDRPIDAVFRRPPRFRDRRVVARALWDSLRRSSPQTPESVRALDDVSWARASIRAFGTRWCTTRLAPALLARTGVDLSAESASIVVPMLCRLLAGAGKSVPLEGGLAGLVTALAEPLRVRLGCRAVDLEATGEGVRIRYESGGREGIALADGVVLALPPSEVLRVVPKLTPIERGYFESMRARRQIVMYRQISEQAWLLRGLSGVTFVPGELPDMRDIRMLGPKFRPYTSDPFWARISLEHEAVDHHWDDSDQVLIYKFDSTFRGSPLGALPEGSSRIERLDEIISVQGRGALARRERFEGRSERTPRISFATEALTTPDLEGRVTAGMRAASDAKEMLVRLQAATRLEG